MSGLENAIRDIRPRTRLPCISVSTLPSICPQSCPQQLYSGRAWAPGQEKSVQVETDATTDSNDAGARNVPAARGGAAVKNEAAPRPAAHDTGSSI